LDPEIEGSHRLRWVFARRPSTYWLLGFQATSLLGTRISFVAIPWFVLTTSGSAALTAFVGTAEMAPYVVAKAFAGPVIDRMGGKRVSVACDVTSAVFVGLIPILHEASALSYPLVLSLVALSGACRGPGDLAKHTLVPTLAERDRLAIRRVSGIAGTSERLSSAVGPALAGVLVGIFGPAGAVSLDALSFVVVAVGVLIAVSGESDQRVASVSGDSNRVRDYVRELRDGWAFLLKSPFLRQFATLVGVTNMLDAGLTSVLLLVWARDQHLGVEAVSLPLAGMAFAGIGGALVATVLADRLPRLATYVSCYVIAGAPRFLILAVHPSLPAVVGVWALSGAAAGMLNPIMNSLVYELVPREVLGRVGALADAIAWSGIPIGGPIASGLVGVGGLPVALVTFAVLYLVTTLRPVASSAWRDATIETSQRP